MNNAYLTFIGSIMLAFIAACSPEQASAPKEGNAIPYPLPEWKGVQGKTLADSKPDFIGQPKAPKDAPNVLIVMLDCCPVTQSGIVAGCCL